MMQKRNIYVPITIGFFAFLALFGVFGFWALDHFFAPEPPRWLILLAVSFFFLGLVFLFICLFRYVRLEEIIVRGTFLDLAGKLGADPEVLKHLASPQIGRRRFAGIWARVPIEFEGRPFLLMAMNVPIPAGRSCLPFIAVTPMGGEASNAKAESPDLHTLENHPKVKQLQAAIKKTTLFEHEGRPALRIPIKSEVSASHLSTAMNVITGITGNYGGRTSITY